MHAQLATFETLEGRQLLSAAVFAPHSVVNGRTLEDWSAAIWQKVFSIPVFDHDGTTIVNPMFDEAPDHALPANGNVWFLFGSFFGGDHQRAVRVPEKTPLFVPLINSEWSNPDTPAAPDFMTLPGNHTAAQLANFAAIEANAVDQLQASLDGQPIPNLFSHRETSPTFSYQLPRRNNIDQVFFGEDIWGRQYPAAADGFYLMLQPLSRGQHTLSFSGHIPDLSATPPLLGEFDFSMTYVIDVVRKNELHQRSTRQSQPVGKTDLAEGMSMDSPARLFGATQMHWSDDQTSSNHLIDQIEQLVEA
ncbi:hypothetical protein BH09PLA1_BH09PLA1_02200 [soil metagenome]